MKQYLELVQDILENGEEKGDRTGTGTMSVFGRMMRFDLSKGFPLITTKKMFWRGIVEELLFFLRGDTNTKVLEEKGIKIWKGNTSREFLDQRGLTEYPEGEAGPIYGSQWTNWNGTYEAKMVEGVRLVVKRKDGYNQLEKLIQTLKENPNDRRMIVSAWNVGDLSKMCLPPCHQEFQCYVANGKLSLMWKQRSVDFGLGAGFNIASYATLTHIFAQLCGYEVGDLIFVGGDVHLYSNHLDQVVEQLTRTPYPLPQLKINKELNSLKDVEQLEFSDFELIGYQAHPAIKMDMAI